VTKVGIEELKSRLSEYVERASSGEPILVTDGSEPVVEMVPISPTRRKLLQLTEAGELSWNGGKPKGLRGIVVRGEPISDTVVRNRR
jgi:prevent-host-death family protein